MKLALGTVQFGLDYGIANPRGKVPSDEVFRILAFARRVGIDLLDTAVGYGEAETVLGRHGCDGFQVVTKLPSLPAGVDPKIWVREQLQNSLRRLGVPAVNAVLLHRSGDLVTARGAELYDALVQVRQQGFARKIGVSIYSPSELDLLPADYRLDLVQAPLSIVDRRIATSGWLDQLHAEGVEIHVRSVYLQGTLLMPPNLVQTRFPQWDALWCTWDSWLTDHRVEPLHACLAFVLSYPQVSRVVLGVDTLMQLQKVLEWYGKPIPIPFPDISTNDEALVHPYRW